MENNQNSQNSQNASSCGIDSTKGKILAFLLTLAKGSKISAGEILEGAKLENGEGSPVIRQLYVAGVINQECRRGKYFIPEEVIILKTEDGSCYEWAGNKPIEGASVSSSGSKKVSKKSLTASEHFEAFRENLSTEFQQALKKELSALEKGIQAEEKKAAAAAEEAAIEAELKKLEEEAAERRRRLEALRSKKD